MSCRTTEKTPCGECRRTVLKGEPFSVCLAMGGKLVYDGYRLFLEPSENSPPDGVYMVEVKDGCIMGFVEPEAPSYQAPPCEPEPYPCAGDGEVIPDPDTGNLTITTPAGKILTKLYVNAEGTLVASGSGNASDPLRLSVPAVGFDLRATTSTPSALGVNGAGTENNPLDVSHALSDIGQSGAGPYEFDDFGHAVKYNAPDTSSGVVSLSTVPEHIVETNTNGAVLLSLPSMGFGHEQTILAYDKTLTVDLQGRVKSIVPRESIAVSERFFQSFDAGVTSMAFQFTTVTQGRLRLTLSGNFSTGGTGIVALPSGYSVVLDGTQMTAFVNNNAKTIEAFTIYAQPIGAHTLTVTVPTATGGASILDLNLCQ